MPRTEQIEIERKYDVDAETKVPELAGAGPVVSTVSDPSFLLRAVYLDTAEHLLLSNRITLRRREGGHDSGWHLKLPSDSASAAIGARREIHAPLGADADEPLPAPLRRLVEAILRGRPVHPVLVLETSRTVTRLLDGDGEQLAEIADDEVTATNPETTVAHSWREWEVELAPGVTISDGEALLDAVTDVLVRSGASVSTSKSKLARGVAAVSVPTPAGVPLATPDIRVLPGTAASFVVESVTRLTADIVALDPLVRDREPDAVHRFRTTIRRLRSVLRVFRGVLDDDEAAWFDEALRQTGRAASANRDLEVAGEVLDETLAGAPDGFVSHQTVGRLHATLREGESDAARDLEHTITDATYFELLDRLERVRTAVADDPIADRDAAKFAAARIAKESKKARKRVRAAAALTVDEFDQAVVHRARKSVRRLRYAIEAQREAGLKGSVGPKAAHAVQDVLGDALDARSAAARFAELADTARWAGEDTFGYGVLATLATGQFRTTFARLPKLAEKL